MSRLLEIVVASAGTMLALGLLTWLVFEGIGLAITSMIERERRARNRRDARARAEQK